MKGDLVKSLVEWNTGFQHNNYDDERKERYRVGNLRMEFLKQNGLFLGSNTVAMTTYVGYYTELDIDDVPIEAPEATRYEYFAAQVDHENRRLTFFAYYWVETYQEILAIKANHNLK